MLYDFDGVDPESLDLVPLAARRALDHAGLKISLKAWQTLELAQRRTLLEAGARGSMDADIVARAVAKATPPATSIEAPDEPREDRVPDDVRETFGPGRPISDSLWASLTPLDRYVLAKVARKGKERRIAAAYDEIVGASGTSPHLAPEGGVRMVGVGQKAVTERRAVAEATVTMSPDAMKRLTQKDAPKGDVLGTARLAGIQAAKRTSDIVPLCHPLSLTHVGIDIEPHTERATVRIVATVEAVDRTGVEMEAMTAASAAALTVYDMLKAVDRAMVIGPVQLLAKSGGRSGDYRRGDS